VSDAVETPAHSPAAPAEALVLRRGRGASCEPRDLIRENLIVIRILDGGQFSLMATPGDEEALALGFLLAEGWIDGVDDVAEVEVCPGGDSVKVRLREGRIRNTATEPQRSLVLHPSCGLCGREDAVPYLAALAPVPGGEPFPLEALWGIADRLRDAQRLFRETGGSHATGLFGRDGRLLVVAEDIGRHAAFDKMAGSAMKRRLGTAGLGAVLSGRSSLEMVAKAVRARLALLVAVGAPSDAGVALAERLGLGLAGFARGDTLTVYAGRHRFAGA